MANNNNTNKPKSLRVLNPKLYQFIMDELNDRHNIHSFDLEITAVEEDSGMLIAIRFGEDYAHCEEVFFTFDVLESRDSEFIDYLHEFADQCKDVMVADYFRMMKP